VNAPRLIDRKKAQARVSDWLGELSSAEAKPLSALFAAKSTLAALMGSLSESSPYLWELVSRDPKRLLRLLNSDPDQHLIALLNKLGCYPKTRAEAKRMAEKLLARGYEEG